MADENIFAQLANVLQNYGLGSLFSVDEAGNPSGWLWQQVLAGVTSPEELTFALEQTPEFQSRFGVIFELRNRAANGENVQVPTVSQVLDYETKYQQAMAAAGAPSWFYDSVDDAHNAMRNNISVTQVVERIDRAYGQLRSMPPEVQQVFAEYYGDAGDGALLAAILDPKKTLAEIDRANRAAFTGGIGKQMGVAVTKEQAQQYAQIDRSQQQIEADLQKAAELQNLTVAQAGEAQGGLTTESAFAAAAMGSAQDLANLEARLTRRKLEQAATGGGALSGQSGIIGAGVV
jgi:hypothetical protein